MCAPFIIETVTREVSRRGFLGAVAACAVPASAREAQPASAASVNQAPRLPKGIGQVIDLTHAFSPALPVFPSYEPIRIRERFTIARDGFAANQVTFDEHTGTHVDAPCHFVPGAVTGDRIPPANLIAPLAVLDISARAAKNPDTLVTVDDVRGWEKRHGRLPSGVLIAMNAGWEARIGRSAEFLNSDSKGVLHAPGFSEESVRFLLDERDIAAVGVDTLSLDAGVAQKFVAHLAVLGAAKYGVELMANLGRVPPAGATVFVGAMKHVGATGGPARVIALV